MEKHSLNTNLIKKPKGSKKYYFQNEHKEFHIELLKNDDLIKKINELLKLLENGDDKQKFKLKFEKIFDKKLFNYNDFLHYLRSFEYIKFRKDKIIVIKNELNIDLNDKIFAKCIKKPLVKYTFKKSLFSPIKISKFIKCLPPNIVKNNNLLLKSPKKIYEIFYFAWTYKYLVFDYGNYVDIYRLKYKEDIMEYQITDKFLSVKYNKIFIGDNERNDSYWELKKGEGRGNSILLQIEKNKYLYIGDGIYEFSTINNDIIQKYFSPVGKSVIPYPYAIGNKYIYFMIEKTYGKIEDYKKIENIIAQRYGWINYGESNIKNYKLKGKILDKQSGIYE
jgi:hypothetical protein